MIRLWSIRGERPLLIIRLKESHTMRDDVCSFIFIINQNEYLNSAQDPAECHVDARIHD